MIGTEGTIKQSMITMHFFHKKKIQVCPDESEIFLITHRLEIKSIFGK